MSDLPSSNSPKPPSDPKKPLGLDEWIAIIVALATLGSISISIITQKKPNTGTVASLKGNQAEAIASPTTDSESSAKQLTLNRVSSSRYPQVAIAEFETRSKSISNTTTIPVIAASTETLAAPPAPMPGPVTPPAPMEAVAPAPMPGPVTPEPPMEAVAPAPMPATVVPPAPMEAVAPAPMPATVVPPAPMEAVAPAPMPGPVTPEPPMEAAPIAPEPPIMEIVTPTAEMESQDMSAAETKQDLQKKLSLPIAYNSRKGEKLLVNSSSRADYLPLTIQFVTQDNLAYSGVASAVMVLNALKVPAPIVPGFNKTYRFFTQKNVFENPQARKIISPETIADRGMTLKQLTRFVRSHGVPAEAYYSSYTGLDDFRQKLIENLEQDYNFVLANYSREAIGQGKSGHISPIAAYNKESDRFLILDVSRYQYPPVWVTAEQLWEATNAVDPASGKTRGFVWVGP
jgi:hypothetical protein